jgi:hypothetical protein
MPQNAHTGGFLKVALALLPTVIFAGGQPRELLAQGPSLATPPSQVAQASNQTVVIDRAALEEILARLDAAESEIGSLRQQGGVADLGAVPADTPPPYVPAGCGDGADDGGDTCDHALKADHADSASFLIPLSTDCGDVTFKPGVRIQTRYTYDDENDNHDFFIRRFRLKAGGDIWDCAWYGMELKIDSSEQYGSADHPAAIVENAWLDYRVWDDNVFCRVGLYDIPISRNALTSDSKLLLMDRSLIKEFLTTFGFTDNTVGMMFHGRPYDGQFEWYVGLFDNIDFEFHPDDADRESDNLMPAGRVVWNVFDPIGPPQGYADYQESYLGEGHRLAFGANAGYLSEAIDVVADEIFDITVWGVDVFYNRGPWVATGEYDWMVRNGEEDFVSDGWFVQGGYYFYDYCWELAARYQVLDPDLDDSGDQQRWTTIGLNRYYWKHNLKIQMEYAFVQEQDDDEGDNLVQVQLQLDY